MINFVEVLKFLWTFQEILQNNKKILNHKQN